MSRGVNALREGARPLHVLLIALGLLLAQGPMLLHLLLVAHTACEHGELIEVAHDAGIAVGPSDPSDQPEARAAHGDHAGHHHCDALAMRHRLAEVSPAIGSAPLSWLEPVTVGGERREKRAVPLLSLAPKGSPPVRSAG